MKDLSRHFSCEALSIKERIYVVKALHKCKYSHPDEALKLADGVLRNPAAYSRGAIRLAVFLEASLDPDRLVPRFPALLKNGNDPLIADLIIGILSDPRSRHLNKLLINLDSDATTTRQEIFTYLKTSSCGGSSSPARSLYFRYTTGPVFKEILDSTLNPVFYGIE